MEIKTLKRMWGFGKESEKDSKTAEKVIEKKEEKKEEQIAEKKEERKVEKKEEKNPEMKRENTSMTASSEPEQSREEDEAADELKELLDQRIVRAIGDMGFTTFTPIQQQAIPYLLEGKDIIGQAQTGTGKTAAFGIPMIQMIQPELRKVQGIILCPTRELAIQAAEELRKLSKYMQGIKVLPIYGGQDINKQISALRGVQIIVGTPGRVMDHMRRHTIKLGDIRMVVLDEADEMLNMGFREDMETILGQIPVEHQTALFSATMPKPILEITGKFQKDARMVKVAAKELTIPLVSQKYYRIKNQDKDAACVRLLEYYQPKLCLIFCNTKTKVDEVTEMLKLHGFHAEGLHGDLSQHQRDVAMGRFRNGSTGILVATDVAARGIDVDDVEAVINYDVPQDIEYYVHRIGRTGRAGRTGRSFTFVTAREIFRIREIEKLCRTKVEEKKLPGASKVLTAKADKYMDLALTLRDHEDIELMKQLLSEKIEKEECDALTMAAVMLKCQIGDKGEEIAEDGYSRHDRRGDRFGRSEGKYGDRKGRSFRGHDDGYKDKNRNESYRGGDQRGRNRGESYRGRGERYKGKSRSEGYRAGCSNSDYKGRSRNENHGGRNRRENKSDVQ